MRLLSTKVQFMLIITLSPIKICFPYSQWKSISTCTPLPRAAEHFTQQGLLALRISIIGGIKLRQQSPCTQNCLYYLRVFASMKDSPAKHFSYSVFIISAFLIELHLPVLFRAGNKNTFLFADNCSCLQTTEAVRPS